MRLSKSRLALASIIGIFAMIVSACGSSSGNSVNVTQTGTYKYTAPTKGGTIVYGDWQPPDGVNVVNSLTGASVANSEVVAATTDACIFQLPDLTLKDKGWLPSQCTTVPTTDNGDEAKDGTSTTIRLDPKAKWSDGSQVTATDYLFYYAVLSDPNVGGAFSPYDKAKLTKIDNFTLRYDWGQPYAAYRLAITPALNAASSQGAWDSSKSGCDSVSADTLKSVSCYSSDAFAKLSATDAFNQTPIVDGPYTVQSFKAGDSIIFVPNPNYYSRFFHTPAAAKLIFQVAGSKDAMIQAYLAGTYDKVEDLTVPDLAKLQSVDSKERFVTSQFSYEHLEFNQRDAAPNAKASGGKSVFADANVRKAFVEAFDRCAAITKILGQDCNDPNIKTNEITVPLDPAYDANVAFPAFNAADAATLLDTAGFKKDAAQVRTYPGTTKEVTINLITRGPNAVRTSFLQLIQADWQKNLNIKVTFANDPLIFKPWDANGTLYRGTYDVALFAFVTNGDCDSVTANVQGDQIPSATLKTGQNYTGIKDDTLDAALLKQRGDTNFTSRIATCKGIFDEIASQNYFEPLYIRANVTLAKQSLQNYFPHPTLAGNQWNIADWGTTSKSQ